MPGTAIAEVLFDRGPMNTTATSSQDLYTGDRPTVPSRDPYSLIWGFRSAEASEGRSALPRCLASRPVITATDAAEPIAARPSRRPNTRRPTTTITTSSTTISTPRVTSSHVGQPWACRSRALRTPKNAPKAATRANGFHMS